MLRKIIICSFPIICMAQESQLHFQDQLTLSQGKTMEIYKRQQLTEMDGLVFDLEKGALLFIEDTIGFDEQEMETSRWMTQDPLKSMYTPITPYGFSLNSPIQYVDNDGRVVTDKDGHPLIMTVDAEGKYTFKLREGASKDAQTYYNNKMKPMLDMLNESKTGRGLISQMDQDARKVVPAYDKDGKYKRGQSFMVDYTFGDFKKTKDKNQIDGVGFELQGLNFTNAATKGEDIIATVTVEYYHILEHTEGAALVNLTDEEINQVYSNSFNVAVGKIIDYRVENNQKVDNSVLDIINVTNERLIKDENFKIKLSDENKAKLKQHNVTVE